MAAFGRRLVFHNDVLQSKAQRRFNGHLVPRLDGKDGGHRPCDPAQTAVRRRLHHGLDAALEAVHIALQILQHGDALPGGLDGAQELLFVLVRLRQRRGGFPP